MALRHGLKKWFGTYEPRVTSWLLNTIQPGDICIDLGCHVGYMSLAMRKSCGKSGRIFAIDPIASNVNWTISSFKENGFQNILGIVCGAGDRNSVMQAHVYEDSDMANFSDSHFEPEIKTQTIKTLQIRTIDSLVQEWGVSEVNYMKIDVEGYEVLVLRGALKTLKKYRPKLLIEIHKDEYGIQIFDMLTELSYEIVDIEGKTLERNMLENRNAQKVQYFIFCSPLKIVRKKKQESLSND